MVPRKVSSYMLLTGIPIDAEDALRSGLVSRLSEDDEALGKEIDTICEAISSKPKKVIELGKAFYRRQIEMGKSHGLSFMSVMCFYHENFRPFRCPQRRREGYGGELAVRGCSGGARRLQGKAQAKLDTHR